MTASATVPLPCLPVLAQARDEARPEAPPATTTVVTDQVLLERTADGDQDAFATLYRRYERPVFGVLLRMAGQRALAEEWLQEAFTRVWLGAASHDPSRGEVKPWIYAIALNTARSELGRKRHRTPHIPLEELGPGLEAAFGGDPTARLDEERHGALLAEALRELPSFLQEVVVLRCSRELTFAQISEATGAPLGTLKSRFHRAVAALRKAVTRPRRGPR